MTGIRSSDDSQIIDKRTKKMYSSRAQSIVARGDTTTLKKEARTAAVRAKKKAKLKAMKKFTTNR